jgi:hypothetical protein
LPVDAAVVVPWRGGDPHREAAWDYVRAKYDGWKLTVAEYNEGPWVKARAVMPAIEESDAAVVVMADADVWCDGLDAAVNAVIDGYAWAVPHRRVKRLNERSTTRVLQGEPPERLQLEEPSYRPAEGGGLVAIRRDVALNIPMDSRFVGYGSEDRCWGMALATLAGEPWRGRSHLWHLWHPPQDRPDRNHGSPETEALRRRYEAAERKPDLMRAILEEIR